MFIVYEWVDGCGKDTQLINSIEYLGEKDKYIQIWKTREPTGNTEAGRIIGHKLLNEWFKDASEALQLYVEDRGQQSEIRRKITEHSVIMSTRFDYSTYAYQWASGLSFEEIYKAHDYSKILIPDLTFIFDVSIENIEKRLNLRWGKREFFEKIDFLDKVRQKYLEVAKLLSKEREILVVDANVSKEWVFEQIKDYLLDKCVSKAKL